MKKIFIYFVLVSTFLGLQNLQASTIEDAVINNERSSKNIARDKYRNPIETLKFFQIKSNMTVIELSPGSGWYTEILSKYLYEEGKLIAAAYNPSLSDYAKRSRDAYEKKLKSKIIKPGETFYFPTYFIHQEVALTDCEIIEASTPYYNDRVRVEKKFKIKLAEGLKSTKYSEIGKF